MNKQTERVRALNDELRRTLTGGTLHLTPGILSLGTEAILQIDQSIQHYDAFTEDNDPYGEHDFGSFEVAGHTVFFKIDCYDIHFQAHSPDPSDPAVTRRVLTVMLAEEY